ncbi:MAG: hypothetical protein K2Q22_03635 [Cytophagales bacterium]|nr:hypothetical protein [Cytophagales bacterium]
MKTFVLFAIGLAFTIRVYAQSQLAYANENVKLMDSTLHEMETLPEGEGLYLGNLTSMKGTYKVKLLRNGKVGYVNQKDLKIERALREDETYDVIKTKERDPILRVHNNSKIAMTLKFAKKDYNLYPGNIINIRIAKGKHYYYVSSSKSEYHYGHENLDDYRLYTWEFYVDDVK